MNQLQLLPDNVFSACPLLRSLDLSRNKISAIEAHAFSGLSHLHSLQLENNQLTILEAPIFRGSPNLFYLGLSNNQLSLVKRSVISDLRNTQQELFIFYLKDNPWTCHCELQWMQELVEVSKSNTTKKELLHTKCTVAKDSSLRNLTQGDKSLVIQDLFADPAVRAKCAELDLSRQSKEGRDDRFRDGSNSILQIRETKGDADSSLAVAADDAAAADVGQRQEHGQNVAPESHLTSASSAVTVLQSIQLSVSLFASYFILSKTLSIM
jgi:hypothetical protein